MNNEEDMQRLRAACEALGEHFDTVQIFATRHEEGDTGTTNAAWGTGNWFARRGQVGEWLLKQDERSREEVRNE